MNIALLLLNVMVLIMIFVEDIRQRSVHLFWFPLLGTGLLAARLLATTVRVELLMDISINLLFLLVQFLLITIYFSIRHKHLINVTRDLLGWGDVLLLLCLTIYLPPINFIAFYVVSLVSILIIWLIYQGTARQPAATLPLAGLQALQLALVIAISCWYKGVSLTNDQWLLSHLA